MKPAVRNPNTSLSFLLFFVFLIIADAGCNRIKSSGKQNETNKETSIRVMSYNIHHAEPPSESGLISPETIAEVIRKENPDLVALQEVDVNNKRSGMDLNQAKAIAEMLGMEFHFAKALDYQGGYYGNAVLSKFPILETMDVEMPTMASVKAEDRVWAGIRIKVEGQDIWFGSTHIDFTNRENNLYQSRTLRDKLILLDDPVIVAGDFNARPDSETLAFFREEFEWTCEGVCPPTSPQIRPRSAIDYIIYRPREFFQAKNHTVIDEEYASDHRPIIADLYFSPK